MVTKYIAHGGKWKQRLRLPICEEEMIAKTRKRTFYELVKNCGQGQSGESGYDPNGGKKDYKK